MHLKSQDTERFRLEVGPVLPRLGRRSLGERAEKDPQDTAEMCP